MYFALKILENIYNHANVPIFSFQIRSTTTALDAWFLRTNGAKKSIMIPYIQHVTFGPLTTKIHFPIKIHWYQVVLGKTW